MVDEDPGLLHDATPLPRAPGRRARVEEPEGLTLRLAYRTYTLPETLRAGVATQRFHAFALDVYPISWYVRLGLSTQVALERDSPGHDWMASEGIIIGLQRPGRVAPFVDAGVHVGLGTRTFYISQIDAEVNELTLAWAYSGEIGVDVSVWRGWKTTLAFGVQQSSYFSNGTVDRPVVTTSDTTWLFKVGIGR